MKWFKNLRVKQKLLLTFSMLLFFLLLLGGIGLYNMSDMNEHTKIISSKRMPGLDILLQIDRDMQQAVVAQRTMIFTNVSSERFKQLKQENEENINQTLERWEQYKTIGAQGIDEQLLADFEEFRGEWVEYSEKIVASRESDTPDGRIEAIDLSFREGTESFEKARNIIDRLTEITEELAEEDIAENEASYSNAQIVLYSGGAIAFILSLLSAFYISKIIADPLSKASHMMTQLKKGRLDTRVEADSSDEIGILMSSMNNFADTLKEFVSNMYKVAEGDLSNHLEVQDKDDEITPAINKIIFTLRELKKETDELIKSALEGRLSNRGDESKFQGGYREIIKGFNDTLNAVIEPTNESAEVLKVMSTGDFTVRVKGNYKGDHQIMKNSINDLGESLNGIISDVAEAVQATASASAQISSSSEEMAAGAQEQSAQTTEVASAVEEMAKTIMETTSNVNIAAKKSTQAGEAAKTGGGVVKQTITGMNRIAEVVNQSVLIVRELGKSSDQIGDIIQVIDDIADQTNLLALNAAIEAARAGEQGRGFAVVADEVRKLAERTTKATKEIAEMIKKIQKDTGGAVKAIESGTEEVEKGKELAGKAGASLDEIINSTSEVLDVINQVAAASEEQSTASEEISRNIEGISNVTQQSSEGTQQIAASAEDLNRLTTGLSDLIRKFKIVEINRRELTSKNYLVDEK
ncbi:MAG: methyl-accepting chemotaxis protein [Ignavibacteria bacterium]|jgi:methyl-accepting chemotaxis protein